MICPICGTQQRTSAQCVQCHTPISGTKKTAEEENDPLGIELSLDESLSPMPPAPNERLKEAVSGLSQKPAPPSHSSYPDSLPAEELLIPKPAVDPLITAKKESTVLIATTQRVEGKRIRRYFGLIHATVIVKLSHKWAASDQGAYPVHFKNGTTNALNALKKEATDIGANAVVATTLNTHRIDSEAILLSAVGTAVFLEGPR